MIDGSLKQAFGVNVPEWELEKWRSSVDDQCIGQAEVAPVLWAKLTWSHVLRGRRVLFFIDNDSARFALVNMYSPVDSTASLLWRVAEADAEAVAISWYARVPSEANLADLPSRLDFQEVLSRGFEVVEPRFS